MAAKGRATSEVFASKKQAEEQKCTNILIQDDEKKDVGEKCVWDDSGSLAFTHDAKKKAWKSH